MGRVVEELIINAVIVFIIGFLALLGHWATTVVWARWLLYGLMALMGGGSFLIGGGLFVLFGLVFAMAGARPEKFKQVQELLKEMDPSHPLFMTGAMALWGLYALLALIPPTRSFTLGLLTRYKTSYPHLIGGVLFVAAVLIHLLFVTVLYDREGFLEKLASQPLLPGVAMMFFSFMVLSWFGVGTFVKRTFTESRERLGLKLLSLKDLAIAIGLAFALLGMIMVFDQCFLEPFFPEVFKGNLDFERAMHVQGDYWEVLMTCILIACCAGIGEELFFRGLIQPAFGIWPGAILFMLIHVHYGPSVLLLQILFLGLAFGLIRNRWNTTAAMVTHATFDILALSLSHFDFAF
jgi:uncharacterized protein